MSNEGEVVVRSAPSFSDWVRPDLQCYETSSSDQPSKEESVLEDILNTRIHSPGNKATKSATVGSHHQPLTVQSAHLRRAVKRSFQLLRVG